MKTALEWTKSYKILQKNKTKHCSNNDLYLLFKYFASQIEILINSQKL